MVVVATVGTEPEASRRIVFDSSEQPALAGVARNVGFGLKVGALGARGDGQGAVVDVVHTPTITGGAGRI